MTIVIESRVSDRVRDAADAWLYAICLQRRVALRRCVFYTPATDEELAAGDAYLAEVDHAEKPGESFAFIAGGLLWLPKIPPPGTNLGEVIEAAVRGMEVHA